MLGSSPDRSPCHRSRVFAKRNELCLNCNCLHPRVAWSRFGKNLFGSPFAPDTRYRLIRPPSRGRSVPHLRVFFPFGRFESPRDEYPARRCPKAYCSRGHETGGSSASRKGLENWRTTGSHRRVYTLSLTRFSPLAFALKLL